MARAAPGLLNACARAAVTWLRRALLFLLYLTGHVPEHVAFVMDGNRRYAERQHVDKATGHTHGYGKMVEVIHWCMELGVRHVSVYAFSIDNFRRSAEEVTALMRLAEDKYGELARDNGLAEREGIRMHIVGDLTLPPPSVQGAAARLMRNTAALQRQRATLNVCFSYTASEESVAAVAELQAAVRQGLLQPGDVTPAALHGALRTRHDCPPVDLLVRTSGETRLSDFLLWQAAHAHLCYLPTLWPDLSVLDFARCVLSYQRQRPLQEALRQKAAAAVAAAAAAAPTAGAAAESAAGAGAGPAAGAACVAATSSEPSAATEATACGQGAACAEEAAAAGPSGVQTGLPRRGGGLRWRGGSSASAGSCPPQQAPGSNSDGAPGPSSPRRSSCRGCQARSSSVPSAGAVSGGRGSGCSGGASEGPQWRLARFFDRLEKARLAWIASHVEL
ncbi:hypothetical protein HXX76_005091 [Chlamydomonas incerta]|uniref:Alkyl transferase n=1 Tax=Chlamydomonas incerta TaxID=51695 RepID=A0A835TGZ2_CHLIN|nr:hypothetical protein HXX76_005091 [Chlamydomonas incerta]|eukprot:KAG2438540.1 hypothetical protein HXX76_005091 [Chlamydomonas incerta]